MPFCASLVEEAPPGIIYSDNGTNFRGTELDVVNASKVWDQENIQLKLTRRGIEWKFNPPAASHKGGVWERLTRSIRRILHSMVGERLVDEETLGTFPVSYTHLTLPTKRIV